VGLATEETRSLVAERVGEAEKQFNGGQGLL